MNCPRFETCSSPICPLAVDILTQVCWFADEETCGLQEFRSLPWVKLQRKIARKTRRDRERGVFTHAMLSLDPPPIVGSRFMGLDPSSDTWNEDHAQWLKEKSRKRRQAPKNLNPFGRKKDVDADVAGTSR
jgi:hypothetical protein